ncbi:MAG TPA: aminoglycoside phosphotransferase family protein [Gaiellaceae bacterium]|nr:aminoglycoside phosphotransferase family protein [Gaiellaceae bacterium]
MSESAVGAAVAVAAEHGLHSDDPTVLSDAWHVLVHLRPFTLVARVSSGKPLQPEERIVVELAVASHAARAGAHVVPPSDLLDPGPHRHGRHVVAFWQYVEPGGELDPRAAGAALRGIHEALADYPGELPELHTVDTLGLVDSLEPSADVEFLRELASRPIDGPVQALHGDAHLGNCLPGPLWHDFETTCRGPREFDLAALALSAETPFQERARLALAAYGDHDRERLDACIASYMAWICASYMVASPRRPSLPPLLDARLSWLREAYG